MSLAWITVILAVCVLALIAAPIAEDIESSEPKASVKYRLPLSIKPINYKISLKPYLNVFDANKFQFDGECFIKIISEEKVNEIQLHIKNLEILISEYYKEGSTEKIKLPKASSNDLTSIVVYKLTTPLEANVAYILHYVYVGNMDEDMHGFYRSSYTTSNNVTKWLGSTQFQRNHARRVFPSFDEPKFKATFDLSLTRHRSLRTAGPTRLIEIKPQGEYITDVYATTPIMSTYLLAFIVSEFNERFDGQFGVIGRPEYYAQTEYSFDVGKKILNALDTYLDTPYYSMGNDKMHMAAIPDFSAGAMENWGLLTYRERALLYDKDDSTLGSQQYIASIVAHEQGHMWFGDLVTCDWWSYTWLNEGFASYFQYFATHLVESKFQMDQQFVIDYVQSVMIMDATNSTNPMTDENTNTEEELARMFNSISYNKGATFIRMTKHIMGEDNFKKSLKAYLNKYKYTNTIPQNLFETWKQYWPDKKIDIADRYFASFTTQVGYPVITFNFTSDTTIQVSQKRFLLRDFDKADPNLLYTVPITYTTSVEKDFQNTTPKFFLENNSIVINVDNNVKWIMGNIQETGYYRINYDVHTWHQIHRSLNAKNWDGIHELNRAQIVDDLFNFARGREIDYNLAFTILDYLRNELNYLVWSAAFNGLSYLAIRLGNDTENFASYIKDITEKPYTLYGFEEKKDDTPFDIYTRASILAWSCKYGKSDCISKTKPYFNANLKASPVPVNIRSAVYCTAMREAHEKDFEKLYYKYKNETVATEEVLLLNSLSCVKDKKLVTRVFQMIISTDVRRQDKSSALTSLYTANNENVETVFDLVNQYFEELSEAMGGYSAVASVVSGIASRFTSEDQLKKLVEFNKKHQSKLGSSLKGAIASVEFNLEWSKNNLGPVKKFLKKYKNGTAFNSISVVVVVLFALIAIILH